MRHACLVHVDNAAESRVLRFLRDRVEHHPVLDVVPVAADLVAEVELTVNPVILALLLAQGDGIGKFVMYLFESSIFLIELREGIAHAAVRKQLLAAVFAGNQAVQRGQVAHRLRRQGGYAVPVNITAIVEIIQSAAVAVEQRLSRTEFALIVH